MVPEFAMLEAEHWLRHPRWPSLPSSKGEIERPMRYGTIMDDLNRGEEDGGKKVEVRFALSELHSEVLSVVCPASISFFHFTLVSPNGFYHRLAAQLVSSLPSISAHFPSVSKLVNRKGVKVP